MHKLPDVAVLQDLRARVVALREPDYLLARRIVQALNLPRSTECTKSLDSVSRLFARVLPDWWISSGQCGLGPHASCGPDGRAHAAAGRVYPEQWDAGFHVDFQHSAPEACARLAVMLDALIALVSEARER